MIIGSCEEQHGLFGWHIGVKDGLVSHLSRRSTDILKEYYRKDCPVKSGTRLKVEREDFQDNLIFRSCCYVLLRFLFRHQSFL